MVAGFLRRSGSASAPALTGRIPTTRFAR